MYGRAAKAYKRVSVESASKSRVVDELFNRFLRDVDDAKQAIGAGDIMAKSAATDHALRIVTELSAALDANVAPELCENLGRLYDFVGQQICVASQQMVVEPLDSAAKVMATLRDGFRQVAERQPV